jgi:hypothetical protein
MVESYVLNHPWLPAALWIVLLVGDYYLTLWGARLYRAQHVYQIEGSYELNPLYERDVDRQRLFSGWLLLWVIVGAALLLGGYAVEAKYAYGVVVGCMIVGDIGIWMGHLENITALRGICGRRPGVIGQVRSSRENTYRRSSFRFAMLGLLAVVLFVLTGSAMILGGCLAFGGLAANDLRLSKRYSSPAASSDPAPGAEEETL